MPEQRPSWARQRLDNLLIDLAVTGLGGGGACPAPDPDPICPDCGRTHYGKGRSRE